MEEGPQPWMTSRICVKGLPKHCTDEQLREHFSQRSELTDAKVVRTRDGASRQFGFVGFRTVEDALAAVKYFNRSFMGAQRLSVESAKKLGGPDLPRPWSKYTEGSSRYKQLHAEEAEPAKPPTVREQKKLRKKGRGEAEGGEVEEDAQLAEFLQLMQPRRAGNIWSNEDASLAPAPAPGKKGGKEQSAANSAAGGAKGAQSGAAAAKKAGGRRKQQEEATESESAEPDEEDEEGEGEEESEEDGAAQQKDAAVVDASVSDMDYLRARMTSEAFAEEEEDPDEAESADEPEEDNEGGAAGGSAEQGEEDLEESEEEEQRRQERRRSHSRAAPSSAPAYAGKDGGQGVETTVAQTEEAAIEETARLFVRNLPYSATEADLAAAFGEHGELAEVHLVLDKATRKSKGIALVQFADAEGALAAKAALDGAIFQGRLLHVLPAHRPPPARLTAAAAAEGGEGTALKGAGGFKGEREAQRRAGAGNRAAWNTLFMRPDTVAAAVAEHYGVSRADLLDRDAADVPVRMALGEAHVLALTKRALADAGVSVDALEEAAAANGRAAAGASVPRSATALLVKNLPYSASEAELEEVFGRCGALARLVLPPTRALALVEFARPADARRAFTSLAYRRFQSVPLYLEWAPAGIFSEDAPVLARPQAPRQQQAAAQKQAGAGRAPDQALAQPVEVVAMPAGDEDAAESSTLFVKNLAFATSDAGLQAHFDGAVSAAGGHIRAARVARKKGPDGNPLSAGYGFVECSSEDVAKIALAKLQGSVLDGHKLVLQLSMRKAGGQVAGQKKGSAADAKKDAAAKGKGTKLVVRNVAFEATRKDVAALFAPFGHVKSCRLPKKFDGSHRGFAFVDFLTKQEARQAAEAVAGTHLYGRRLVVEWAEADEGGLDELRAKTAARFRADEADGDAGLQQEQQQQQQEEEEEEARPPPAKKRRKQPKSV